ncbi:MAG: hypothetical protein LBD79_00585 [Treponema sp.]|nr:hypothetical protein [Treponema sp.]
MIDGRAAVVKLKKNANPTPLVTVHIPQLAVNTPWFLVLERAMFAPEIYHISVVRWYSTGRPPVSRTITRDIDMAAQSLTP